MTEPSVTGKLHVYLFALRILDCILDMLTFQNLSRARRILQIRLSVGSDRAESEQCRVSLFIINVVQLQPSCLCWRIQRLTRRLISCCSDETTRTQLQMKSGMQARVNEFLMRCKGWKPPPIAFCEADSCRFSLRNQICATKYAIKTGSWTESICELTVSCWRKTYWWYWSGSERTQRTLRLPPEETGLCVEI